MFGTEFTGTEFTGTEFTGPNSLGPNLLVPNLPVTTQEKPCQSVYSSAAKKKVGI